MDFNNERLHLAAAVVLLVSAVPAGAQAPSRVTPETLAPTRPPVAAGVVIPATEPGVAPAGAERLSIRLSAVRVEGGDPAFRAETEAAVAKVVGKRVTVQALYAVAAEIEAAYARAGYVLRRIVIPPQSLQDGGTLRMVMLDGFIEEIVDTGVPERQRALVRRRLADLIGVPGLRLVDIERRLLIAADVPGLTLRSAIGKGSKIGGARLVVDADWRPVSVAVGGDNFVGRSYGDVSFNTQVSFNSVFGAGEMIYGSLISGRDLENVFNDQPLRRVAGVGAFLPIGTDGLVLAPEYTRSDTNPITPAGGIRTVGRFERFSMRALYPVVRTRAATLNLAIGFEAIEERQRAPDFGVDLNLDRLRTLTFGVDGVRSFDGGATLGGSMVLTQGLDAFGARTQADAIASGVPLSRLGSRPDFTKVDGRLRYDQILVERITLSGIVRGQWAVSGALPTAAMFALDGGEALSSFALGALSVDSGATARAELARPFTLDGGGLTPTLSPYVFGAVGAGSLERPTALERASVQANAFGAGLRVNLAEATTGVAAAFQVEVGRAHANTIARDDTRVNVSGVIRY